MALGLFREKAFGIQGNQVGMQLTKSVENYIEYLNTTQKGREASN